MPPDSIHQHSITKTRDYQKEMLIPDNNNFEFQRAKLWFWPIVFGFTIFMGFINGVKGAFIGFMYGVVAGLFLIHESLDRKKKW